MEQLLEQLVELIPIFAGAVIALAGGALKYWIDRSERRKQIRREKLERLLQLAYDLKPWTGKVDDRYTFGTISDHLLSPIEEMEVLSNLYFPDLTSDIDAVILAAHEYKRVALDIGSERLAAGGSVPKDASDRAKQPYQALVNAVQRLSTKARQIATKL